MDVAIGSRIRTERKLRGLRLGDVARTIGISIGTISKIENDKVSPTFQTLVRLAEIYDIPLADLVSTPRDQKPSGTIAISRADEVALMRTPSFELGALCGALMRKRMNPIFNRVLATQDRMGEGLVAHSGEEFLYVLKGRVRIATEFYTPIDLGVGDCAYFSSAMAHTFISLSEAAAELLVIWFDPNPSSGRASDKIPGLLLAASPSSPIPPASGRRSHRGHS